MILSAALSSDGVFKDDLGDIGAPDTGVIPIYDTMMPIAAGDDRDGGMRAAARLYLRRSSKPMR